MFLKGETSIVQVPITPQYDYYGSSEVQKLVILQQMRNQRMSEIIYRRAQQVKPPHSPCRVLRHPRRKELCFQPRRFAAEFDMPNAKVGRLALEMPADLFGGHQGN